MSVPLVFPPAVPLLEADGLTLREMSERDVPAWFERASDPESSALSGDPIPESVDVCFGWLEVHRQLFHERRGIRWAIVPPGAAGSVGSIGLSNLSLEERSAELGAVIARAYWNRGIVTAAARMVVRYAFDDLGLVEIRADLLQRNHASKRVLEKLGFRFDRVLEGYQRDESGCEDGYLYILRKVGEPGG